jgi:hypothetical protein
LAGAQESSLPLSYGIIPAEQRDALYKELFGNEDIYFFNDDFGETLISYDSAGNPQVIAKARLLGTAQSGILILAGFKYSEPLTLNKVYTFENGDSLPKLGVYKRGKAEYLSQFEDTDSSAGLRVDGITGATKICKPLTKEIKAVVSKALAESRSGNYGFELRQAGNVWLRKPRPVLPATTPKEETEPQAEIAPEKAAATETAEHEAVAEPQAEPAVEEKPAEVIAEAARESEAVAEEASDSKKKQNEIVETVCELSKEVRGTSEEVSGAIAEMRKVLNEAIREAVEFQQQQQAMLEEIEKRLEEVLAEKEPLPGAAARPVELAEPELPEASQLPEEPFGSGEGAFEYSPSFEDKLYEASTAIGIVEIGLMIAGVGVVAFSAARRVKGR